MGVEKNMKCSFCGHELEKGSNFCPECGTMMSFDDEPQEERKVSSEQKYEPDSADTYAKDPVESAVPSKQPEEEEISVPEYIPKAPSAFEDYNTIRSNEEAAEAKNEPEEEDDPFAELHPDDKNKGSLAPAPSEDKEPEDISDDDDMYVKTGKSKKGTVAIAVLAVVLVAVIVIGVSAVKNGPDGILSVFKRTETTASSNTGTSEPSSESTAPSSAEKTTKPSAEKTTEKTTAKDESKTTSKPSESKTTAKPETTTGERKTTVSEPAKPSATTKAYTTRAYTTTTRISTTKPQTTAAPATTSQSLKKPDKYYASAKTRYASVNGVSMRLRPSASSGVRASLSIGGEVKVYAEENGFYYVYYPRYGVYGWVNAKYLSSERPVAQKEVKVSGVVSPDKTYSNPKTKTVTASEGLRLRKGPGTDYSTIRYLGKGYPVSVKGESSKNPGWVYVTDITRGISGWVSAAYLK